MPDTEKDLYGEIIGCEEMHTSLVIEDSKERYQAETPEYLAPVAEITHESNPNPNKRFYDNKARYLDIEEGDGNVKIIISGVPYSKAAELTGKCYDESTGLFFDAGAPKKAPWRTLSGKMTIGGGEYKFFNYLKGKFALGSEQARTKENNITVNTTELTFIPVITEHKFQLDSDTISGVRAVKADTTDRNFTKKDTWFNEIQMPPEEPYTANASVEEGEEGEEEE